MAMLAPLTTLFFLSVLWLLAILGAAIAEESGGKIAAALNCDRVPAKSGSLIMPRGRVRARTRAPRSSEVRLRAAA